MAQAKLQLRYRLSIAGLVMMALFSSVLTGCIADDGPVGMTLLFQSAGHPVGVARFDFDGQRGPVPGAVGGMSPKSGKQMSFMPGDSTRGMPKFVEIEWTVINPALDAWWQENISNRTDKYSPKWNKDYEEAMRRVPRYTRRIDLTLIITPELLAQVRADRHGSLLKLIITFNNDQVDIKAEIEKWR